MAQPAKGPRLGGGSAHERLILANLATALFEHGRITTTEAKARRLRPVAEKLITKAKKGDLHNRRQVMRTVRDKDVAHVLLTEIGPRFENRPGGYTRITKLGPRKGDSAPMAVIELVEALTVQQTAVREAEGATRRAVKETAAPVSTQKPAPVVVSEDPAAESPVEDAAAEDTAADETAAEDTAAEDTAADDTAAEGAPGAVSTEKKDAEDS